MQSSFRTTVSSAFRQQITLFGLLNLLILLPALAGAETAAEDRAADRRQLEQARELGYLESPDTAIDELERLLAGGPEPRIAQEARLSIAALKFAQGRYSETRNILHQVLSQARDWDLVKLATYELKELDRRVARGTSTNDRMAQCGVQALHEVLRLRNKALPVEAVARQVAVRDGMTSLDELRITAERNGLDALGVRLDFDALVRAPKPVIAHFQPNHFVVVTKAGEEGVEILDGGPRATRLSGERFRASWSGAALLFPGAEGSVETMERLARLSPRELRTIVGGHHLHGNHLGDSSSNPATPYDEGPSSPNPCGGAGLPRISVNLANFNLLIQDLDFAYGSLGPGVFLERTYNADDPEEGIFGRSWTFNYAMAVEEQANGSVNLRRASGKEEFFPLLGCTAGTCTFQPPLWVHDELFKHPDGTFELREKRTRLIDRFDPAGRLASIEDRSGNAVTLSYTGGRLTAVTDAAGRVATFFYGANGKVGKVVDPANREALFAYDGAGNLTQTVDMAGNVVSYTYDANSYMSSVTTPAGTWSITNVPYDEPAFGLVVESITDPLGHRTRYSTPGLVVVDVENANGIIWKYFPTGEGQLGSRIDPLGNETEFLYNSAGDLTRVIDPLNNDVRIDRDARGNPTRIVDPLDQETRLVFDGDDQLTRLTDALSRVSTFAYNAQGKLVQITDPLSGVTLFSYDSHGQLTGLTDSRGNTTSFAYDAQGNLTSMTTPLGKQTLYAHDALGRVTSVTTPRGITKQYEWDGIDRLQKVIYPDDSEVTFTYGCCQLTSVSGPAGTISFTYDQANRPVSSTDLWGNTIGYGLDPGGRLTSLTYPDGKIVSYAYDAANRLTHVTDWLLNTTSYRYDELGRLLRTDLPNGGIALQSYDAASRLVSLLNLGPDASILSRYRYTYDAVGNRTGVDLSEPVPPSILSQAFTYQYDVDNRLTSSGVATYEYDDDGNLITETTAAGVASYEYDFEGRLVRRTAANGETVEYRYDDLGTRVGEKVNGVEVRAVVDPLASLSQLLAETDAAGNAWSFYVHALGVASKANASGQAFWYQYDGLGNVITVTDGIGAAVNRYGYTPYGEIFNGSSEAVESPFQFVGRFGVRQNGNWTDMRARFYRADIGRFINQDPIGLAGGLNLFSYAKENPLRWIDPTGTAVGVNIGLPTVFLWGVPIATTLSGHRVGSGKYTVSISVGPGLSTGVLELVFGENPSPGATAVAWGSAHCGRFGGRLTHDLISRQTTKELGPGIGAGVGAAGVITILFD